MKTVKFYSALFILLTCCFACSQVRPIVVDTPESTNIRTESEITLEPSISQEPEITEEQFNDKTPDDKDSTEAMQEIINLEDESTLQQLAYFDSSRAVRRQATIEIKNEESLQHIAYFDKDPKIRKIATSKISRAEALQHIAYTDEDENVRLVALDRLVQLKKN